MQQARVDVVEGTSFSKFVDRVVDDVFTVYDTADHQLLRAALTLALSPFSDDLGKVCENARLTASMDRAWIDFTRENGNADAACEALFRKVFRLGGEELACSVARSTLR